MQNHNVMLTKIAQRLADSWTGLVSDRFSSIEHNINDVMSNSYAVMSDSCT